MRINIKKSNSDYFKYNKFEIIFTQLLFSQIMFSLKNELYLIYI